MPACRPVKRWAFLTEISLALQGPFSREMNAAMLAQYQIRWLVTKDGGAVGDMRKSTRRPQERGVPVILIRRPGTVAVPWRNC